jgi:hypothetical protein
MTPHSACEFLGVNGSREYQYRRDGVSDTVAERFALRVGLHPFTVWPEMADARIGELERACEDCGAKFIPYRASRDRYCSRDCGRRARQRKRYARLSKSKAFRVAERERQRQYRADVRAIRERREIHRAHVPLAQSTDTDAEVA